MPGYPAGVPSGRAVAAVIFDFGGVLVTSPFDMMGRAGRASGVDEGVMLELLMGDYGADDDHPWHRLERGEISFGDYAVDLQQRAAAAGIDLSGRGGGGFYERLEVHEPVVERVRTLRAEGYATALLTNNVKEFGAAWRALVPVDELFDVVVDSCEVGMRKPNPRIYEHTLRELGGVAPGDAVFLDDADSNVEAARRIGLRAILVRDPETALVELDAMLAGS